MNTTPNFANTDFTDREATDALLDRAGKVAHEAWTKATIEEAQRRLLRYDQCHAELLAIHEAVMNPVDVVINESDTYTLKRVKEFILKAIE